MTSAADEKVAVARVDRWRLPDLSRPVLIAVAALLVVMIVLPMGWLVVYSLSDKQGQPTLGNFVTLFTDPELRRSADHHADHRRLGERDLLRWSRRRWAGWWRAPTCRSAAPCARWSWPRW